MPNIILDPSGDVVNRNDLLEAIYKALIVDKNAGMQLSGKNAQEPFEGSATITKTFSKTMNGFCISNDGASSLTFTINGFTFTVLSKEVFIENFAPFTQVKVTTTVPFRAYGLGA